MAKSRNETPGYCDTQKRSTTKKKDFHLLSSLAPQCLSKYLNFLRVSRESLAQYRAKNYESINLKLCIKIAGQTVRKENIDLVS